MPSANTNSKEKCIIVLLETNIHLDVLNLKCGAFVLSAASNERSSRPRAEPEPSLIYLHDATLASRIPEFLLVRTDQPSSFLNSEEFI